MGLNSCLNCELLKMLLFITKYFSTFVHQSFVCFCLSNKLVGGNLPTHTQTIDYVPRSSKYKTVLSRSIYLLRFGKACNYLTGKRKPSTRSVKSETVLCKKLATKDDYILQ